MNIQEVLLTNSDFFELSPRLWLFLWNYHKVPICFFLLLDTFPFFIMPFARQCWSFWKILRGFMSKLFTFGCCQPLRLLVCKTIVLLVMIKISCTNLYPQQVDTAVWTTGDFSGSFLNGNFFPQASKCSLCKNDYAL